MALARCEAHKPLPSKYVFVAEPVATIRCSSKDNCTESPRVWLNAIEAYKYTLTGVRIFRLPFHPAKKATVKDGGRYLSETSNAPQDLSAWAEYR